MYKEWKYKEMVTMQAGGLLLTRHSGTLCRARGDRMLNKNTYFQTVPLVARNKEIRGCGCHASY